MDGKNIPDEELVMVRVKLGTPYPVAVSRQYLGGLTQVARVPELHLAVAACGN